MTDDTAAPSREPLRRVWHPRAKQALLDAAVSIETLNVRLDALVARNNDLSPWDKVRKKLHLGVETRASSDAQAVERVRSLLKLGELATQELYPAPSNFFQRHWDGVHIQAAYECYHAARVQAVELYSSNEIEAELPTEIIRATSYWGPDDKRLRQAYRIAQARPLFRQRDLMMQLIRANYEESDLQQRRLRRFRNVLLVSSIGTMLLVILGAGLLAMEPGWVSFCFEPPGDSTTTAKAAVQSESNSQKQVCPTAIEQAPQGQDVAMVVAMGLFGGGLAAAVSLRTLGGATTTYDVPVFLGALKIPTGAMTAIAGLLAIKGGFVPGLSNLDSPAQILAYALIFGYSQQIATGFLDRRVQAIEART